MASKITIKIDFLLKKRRVGTEEVKIISVRAILTNHGSIVSRCYWNSEIVIGCWKHRVKGNRFRSIWNCYFTCTKQLRATTLQWTKKKDCSFVSDVPGILQELMLPEVAPNATNANATEFVWSAKASGNYANTWWFNRARGDYQSCKYCEWQYYTSKTSRRWFVRAIWSNLSGISTGRHTVLQAWARR